MSEYALFMKVLPKDRKPSVAATHPLDLAAALLTLIPRMMATLRQQLQSTDGLELRGGQFRLLMIVDAHHPISISRAACLLGLTVPTTSKIADELTQQNLLSRQSDAADRRRVLLSLTTHGKSVLETVSEAARTHLATLLKPLTPTERSFILCSVETLRPLFERPAGQKVSQSSENPDR